MSKLMHVVLAQAFLQPVALMLVVLSGSIVEGLLFLAIMCIAAWRIVDLQKGVIVGITNVKLLTPDMRYNLNEPYITSLEHDTQEIARIFTEGTLPKDAVWKMINK